MKNQLTPDKSKKLINVYYNLKVKDKNNCKEYQVLIEIEEFTTDYVRLLYSY